MNKGNAEKLKEQLLKEISDMVSIEGALLIKGRGMAEGRLKKVQEMRDAKRKRLEELKELVAKNHESLKSSEPEGLEDLSQLGTRLANEQTEIEKQLEELEKRILPDIEKNLSEAREAIGEKIYEFMLDRKKRYTEEVYEVVHEFIEPRISAWQQVVSQIAFEHQLGFQLKMTVRDIEFYSPLISDACDKYGRHDLVMMAHNFENGIKQPVGAAPESGTQTENEAQDPACPAVTAARPAGNRQR